MAEPPNVVLTAAQQSLAAACARDRGAWLALFAPDAAIEDPVGSRPHRGAAEIARFYDTFIAPREMSFDLTADLVVDSTVLRDVELLITMAEGVNLRVPAYLRYDLVPGGGDLELARLRAYWDMPSMVGQFLRRGVKALPAGGALAKTLLTNQGLAGAVGFASGLRRPGASARRNFEQLLDGLCSGDEVAARRGRIDRVTVGDDRPLAIADLVRRLTGSQWHKVVGAGGNLLARFEPGAHVVIADVAGTPAGPLGIRHLRYFPGAGG